MVNIYDALGDYSIDDHICEICGDEIPLRIGKTIFSLDFYKEYGVNGILICPKCLYERFSDWLILKKLGEEKK